GGLLSVCLANSLHPAAAAFPPVEPGGRSEGHTGPGILCLTRSWPGLFSAPPAPEIRVVLVLCPGSLWMKSDVASLFAGLCGAAHGRTRPRGGLHSAAATRAPSSSASGIRHPSAVHHPTSHDGAGHRTCTVSLALERHEKKEI